MRLRRSHHWQTDRRHSVDIGRRQTAKSRCHSSHQLSLPSLPVYSWGSCRVHQTPTHNFSLPIKVVEASNISLISKAENRSSVPYLSFKVVLGPAGDNRTKKHNRESNKYTGRFTASKKCNPCKKNLGSKLDDMCHDEEDYSS